MKMVVIHKGRKELKDESYPDFKKRSIILRAKDAEK